MANKNNRQLTAVWRYFTEEDIKNLPATQREAYKEDSIYYFTGKACKHGHIAPKLRCSKYCVVCNSNNNGKKKILVKKIKVENPEPILVLGIKLSCLLSENKE